MAAEATLLDTNVLIARSHPKRRGHEAARGLLAAEGDLATTPQVIREFLVVATRPFEANGLGLTVDQAVHSAEAFLERLRLLPEDARVAWRLRQLVREGRCQGVTIHDANVVASALVHGVQRIVTDNARHFERFADLVEIVPLT